jgi:hypothetical protein
MITTKKLILPHHDTRKKTLVSKSPIIQLHYECNEKVQPPQSNDRRFAESKILDLAAVVMAAILDASWKILT